MLLTTHTAANAEDAIVYIRETIQAEFSAAQKHQSNAAQQDKHYLQGKVDAYNDVLLLLDNTEWKQP